MGKVLSVSSLGGQLREYQFTVFFEPQEDGFNVVVPAIPEICTFGATLEEAREMAEDAIRCYLESAIKNGETIPKDIDPRKERLAVAV
jgi:antitoxin HicB